MLTRNIDGLLPDAKGVLRTCSDWKLIAKGHWSFAAVMAFVLISSVIAWLALNYAPAYMVSIAYACALTFVFIVSRRWRLSAFLLMFMGGPPYLEYELAWVAITGRRLRPEFGLRTEIFSVVFSAYDLMLLIGTVIFVHKLVRRRSLPRRLVPFLFGMLLLVALGSASALVASSANPGSGRAVLAGYMTVLRPIGTLLSVLGCWDTGLHNEETAIGLAIGTILFLGQSLVVSIVKYGWFTLGQRQLTGLIPGAGATGSFLVLVIPILLALGLCSTNERQGRRFVVIGLLGSLYIFLTLSRTAVIGLTVAIIVLAVSTLHTLQFSKVRPLVAALTATGVFVLRFQASDYFAHKFRLMLQGSPLDYYNLEARARIWSTALGLARENWISGIGPCMWGVVTIGLGHHVHNGYLQYVVELGIPAATVFAAILLRTLTDLWRYIKTRSMPPKGKHDLGFAVGILAGICGYMATQVFENTVMHHRVTGILWWAIAYAMLLPAANMEDR